MVMLNIDVVMKRLQDIQNPSQEAIETMTLWIMHYKDKASIDVIVDGWMKAFRIATTDERRIALFYVMNHVVQKAKMKNIDTLMISFQPHVLTAIGIGRKSEKVKAVMKKCLELFGQREVFTNATITAMENLLEADDVYDTEDTVLDIDSDEIVRKITSFVSARSVVTEMMKNVNDGDFDYKERIKNGMRDREEGAHVLEEVHTAINTVKSVRISMDAQKKKMIELIETLELAKRVYMHQKREVLVVEEAYINFRDGIKAVHEELVEMESTGVYPGVTPPREAPSPRPDEDIYATGVENAIQHLRAPETWDNRQAIDMEMDDEERPQASIPIPQPIEQPSLKSRIALLGLVAEEEESAKKNEFEVKKDPDYSKPPPMFNMSLPPPGTSSTMNAFGVTSQQSKSTEQSSNAPLTFTRSQHADIQQIINKINNPLPVPNVGVPPPGTQSTQSIYQMLLKQQGFPSTAGTSSDKDERSGPAPQLQQVAQQQVQAQQISPGTGGYTARFGSVDGLSAVTSRRPSSENELRRFPNDGPPGLNSAAFSQNLLSPVQLGYTARFDCPPPGIDVSVPPPIQQPLISPQGGYQATFEPRDPRMVSQSNFVSNTSSHPFDPRMQQQSGYQAKFDAPPPQRQHSDYHANFDSPPSQRRGSASGYQARFDSNHRDSREYNRRSPDRRDRRDDRHGVGNHRGRDHDDRESSANGHYRSEGGYRGGFRGGNDRYRGNRDNWRGGSSHGNYNRY